MQNCQSANPRRGLKETVVLSDARRIGSALPSLNLARISEFQLLLKDEIFSSTVRRLQMIFLDGERLSSEARKSAFSFPMIPACLGIHTSTPFVPAEARHDTKLRISRQ